MSPKPPSGPHSAPPCVYAKAIMYLMSVFGALGVFLVPFLTLRLSATEAKLSEEDKAITELKTDVRYIRDSVTEIKDALRLRPTAPGSP